MTIDQYNTSIYVIDDYWVCKNSKEGWTIIVCGNLCDPTILLGEELPSNPWILSFSLKILHQFPEGILHWSGLCVCVFFLYSIEKLRPDHNPDVPIWGTFGCLLYLSISLYLPTSIWHPFSPPCHIILYFTSTMHHPFRSAFCTKLFHWVHNTPNWKCVLGQIENL